MEEIITIVALVALVIILFVAIISYVRIVPQSEAYVIERLGAYHQTLGVGFHVLTPIVDRIVKKISLKEQILDFPPQPVITRDNVTIQIDTVIYYFITDPKLYTYGIDNPVMAIEKMTATTIRNIIGELELDETLTSRETVNSKVRLIIDEATDPWGIKINRVELKNIIPPRDIQEAMEKQMRAERERREAVLRAEGEKHSAILKAEGEKESVLLRAEAKRQQMIAEAKGQADAILLIAEAQAKGIQMISQARPGAEYLTLKGFEALEKVADGQATKLIIPSQIQDVTGLLASLRETLSGDEKLSRRTHDSAESEESDETDALEMPETNPILPATTLQATPVPHAPLMRK